MHCSQLSLHLVAVKGNQIRIIVTCEVFIVKVKSMLDTQPRSRFSTEEFSEWSIICGHRFIHIKILFFPALSSFGENPQLWFDFYADGDPYDPFDEFVRVRALSTIIEDGEGQGEEQGEEDDEYVRLDDVRTAMASLSSPTAGGPGGVTLNLSTSEVVTDSNDDEIGPSAPPRSTSLRSHRQSPRAQRHIQGEGEGGVVVGEVPPEVREDVLTPVSKEGVRTPESSNAIGTLEDCGTPINREDARTPVNRDDVGSPLSREDVRTPVNAEDLGAHGTPENIGTPENPGTPMGRNIGSPEHVRTLVESRENVETPVRSKIRTPGDAGSPVNSKDTPLTAEGGDEVPNSNPPGLGVKASPEHGLAFIVSPPPEEETTPTPSADLAPDNNVTLISSSSDTNSTPGTDAITSNLDTNAASPADSAVSNLDTDKNPTAASNVEGNTDSPGSPRASGTTATSPPASNLDLAAASTTSPTSSNLDIATASRTSQNSCPIQSDLDRRERMAAVASAAAARLASNLEKSPVRRTTSSNTNSPILRSKFPHTPTMSRRPSSEMLVLQPLSPEHGTDLNERYEFLRRTLSHSQRRYSQRGRRQRDKQPGARVPSGNVASEGTSGGAVANGVIANGSMASGGAAYVPRSGLERTLSSRDYRQKKAIGSLRDIVRGNEHQAPPTSSPPGEDGNTEAHVDQHGRTYYMDHSTRTIAFDRRAGPQASPQLEVQTRREMLDRR